MSSKTYQIDRNLDIGGGLKATAVRVSDGPIVLVDTVDKQEGRLRLSRLDLHKRMFIDPLPGQRDASGVSALVSWVVEHAASGAPRV
jgi:hypothetical protein